MAVVETGARLHFGFQNLSLANDRLYGGVGVALAEPQITVTAEPAATLSCEPAIRSYCEAVIETLDVRGADISVELFPRHVGLGSGTQLSLACLCAVASAYDIDCRPRERAPAVGRGGRSGVGVATFERGGFVIDAGHPTERFTTEPPAPGDWKVPEPLGCWSLPDAWRFVIVIPETEAGPSGETEDEQMRAVVERANPSIADEIATVLTRRLLPAVVEDDLTAFGQAVARLGRLNGAWYADEQGGVYRPPAGPIIESLSASRAITGAGQSSWGPTVYGVTAKDMQGQAETAGKQALMDAGVDGSVQIVRPGKTGATIVE